MNSFFYKFVIVFILSFCGHALASDEPVNDSNNKATATSNSWPPEVKLEMTNGCKESFIQSAQADYMANYQIQRVEELPLHFRARAEQVLAPFFAVCECITTNVTQQWTYEYFLEHQNEYQIKAQSLIADGTCPLPEAKK